MSDFWDDDALLAMPKVSSMPKRVRPRRSENPQPVKQQLETTNAALADAFDEEKALNAKYGPASGQKYISVSTTNVNRGVKRPERMPTLSRQSSSTAVTPPVPPTISLPDIEPGDPGKVSSRNIAILKLLNENPRLTLDQIATRIHAVEQKPDMDFIKTKESLRRSNLARMEARGFIIKITPTEGASPFFVMSRLGQLCLTERLPLDPQLMTRGFSHEEEDIREHNWYMNMASAVVHLMNGSIKIEQQMTSRGLMNEFILPPQPVITAHRIAAAANTVNVTGKGDVNELQHKIAQNWLELSEAQGGLPCYRDGEFSWKDMTKEKSQTLLNRMKNVFDTEVTVRGRDETFTVLPSWLFSMFTEDGMPEPIQHAHFVLPQPSRLVHGSYGLTQRKSGSIVGRLETRMLGVDLWEDIYLELFKSNLGYASCLVLTEGDASIRQKISVAWKNLIQKGKETGRIDKYPSESDAHWITFGTYAPINSSGVTVSDYFPSPPNSSGKTYFMG